MAMAMIEVLAGQSDAHKRGLLEGVRRALCESLRVPRDDPTIRLIEHQPDSILVPPRYSGKYTIITITMFHGRSLSTKRQLYRSLAEELSPLGVHGINVQIILHEPVMENWSQAGIPASDTDPGFKVDI